MGRKLEVKSAFAYAGHYITPRNVHVLDKMSDEELQPFFDAGCLRVVDENPFEVSPKPREEEPEPDDFEFNSEETE